MLSSLTNFVKSLFFGCLCFVCDERIHNILSSILVVEEVQEEAWWSYILWHLFLKKKIGDKMSTFLVMNTHHSRLNIWRFLMKFLAFLFRECFVTLERTFDIHRPFFMISTKRCWSQNFWCGMVGDKNCASSWKMESSWKFQSSRS